MKSPFPSGTKIEHCRQHLILRLPEGYRYVGTPVLGNGSGVSDTIINLRVEENLKGEKREFSHPRESLKAYAAAQGLSEDTIGMMTSASMNSYRSAVQERGKLLVEAHCTSGLSNARAAGDRAEYSYPFLYKPPTGTINTILIVHWPMTGQAAIEGLLIATEAKSLLLFEQGVRSKTSRRMATGTGTDSLVLLSPRDRREPVEYAGKHTITGELIAKAVMESLKASLLS